MLQFDTRSKHRGATVVEIDRVGVSRRSDAFALHLAIVPVSAHYSLLTVSGEYFRETALHHLIMTQSGTAYQHGRRT